MNEISNIRRSTSARLISLGVIAVEVDSSRIEPVHVDNRTSHFIERDTSIRDDHLSTDTYMCREMYYRGGRWEERPRKRNENILR